MFKKAELEIYDLDLADVIITSNPDNNFVDDDDDMTLWPHKR